MGGGQSIAQSDPATPPPLETKIPLDELVADESKHEALVLNCLKANGLITFRLDAETQACACLSSDWLSLLATER